MLFSRAKQQIVTFSSMTAADIQADENGNPGPYMLKRWLEYSATGLLHHGKSTPREPGSDFEIFVIGQLQSMGCEPVPQVGVAGFFIDIGVKHPSWPHGFLMGVECDGESYHSSKSARDRDRLRQEVLEGLGWHLYRIWSTDWFNDPRRGTEALRQAIEARLAWLENNDRPPSAGDDEEPIEVSQGRDEEESPISDSGDLARGDEIASPLTTLLSQSPADAEGTDPRYVGVGDTVQVRYLSGTEPALKITLSDQVNAPNRGIVHVDRPLGHALVGAEEGDEIEILVGNFVREAVIERVIRGNETGGDISPGIVSQDE